MKRDKLLKAENGQLWPLVLANLPQDFNATDVENAILHAIGVMQVLHERLQESPLEHVEHDAVRYRVGTERDGSLWFEEVGHSEFVRPTNSNIRRVRIKEEPEVYFGLMDAIDECIRRMGHNFTAEDNTWWRQRMGEESIGRCQFERLWVQFVVGLHMEEFSSR